MQQQYANDYTTSVKTYYKELKSYKPITRTKERELIRKAKRGDLKARNKLIEANLRFVFDTAKHYKGCGVPIGDLISDGNLGLIKAIEKFDESKDVKFISYAIWWIKQGILENIEKNSKKKKVEVEDDEINASIASTVTQLDYDKEEVVKNETEYINNYEPSEPPELLVEDLLSKLNEQERSIIEKYFGVNGQKAMTLDELGEEFNLSKERIRQIKKKSFRLMRTHVMMSEQTIY